MRQWLPEKLRKHKFKKLLPDSEQLPDTDDLYREIEAYLAVYHGSWAQWRAEPDHERGRLIAFHIVRSYRDAYMHEKSEEYRKRKSDGRGFDGSDPGEELLKRYGIA